jgi:hypothetical protein
MRRAAAGALTAVALGALLALTACGSVTAKHTDGGGTGGTHADSSTKMDVAADRKVEDARQDVSSPAKDMGTADGRMKDALTSDAHGPDSSSSQDAAGGQCKSDGDCTLWPKYGKSCCGVCQPTSDPAPNKPTCLVACKTPLVTCACVNQQCVGGTS